MLRPIFKVARLPIWTYDFAPHDAGRYPILNGQIYAARHRSQHEGYGITHPPYYLYPATVDAYRAERQMPVEESANAILMAAAAGYADGDWRIAKDNLDLLQLWAGAPRPRSTATKPNGGQTAGWNGQPWAITQP